MLVEFSVSNYRSVNKAITLSFTSAKAPISKREHSCIETGFSSAPYLNEIAAIWGANGSGKTNILKALSFFRYFVKNSSKNMQYDEDIDIDNFAFSTRSRNDPSEFEIVFVYEGFLYQYGFAVDRKRVYEEWLYATPQDSEKQKPQRWFERDPDNIENSYVRPELKGPKAQWKSLTRDNALFLSTAVQNNSKDFQKPYEWIDNFLRIIVEPSSMPHGYSASQFANGRFQKQINKFMKDVDPHIHSIHTEEIELDLLKDAENIFSEEIKKEFAKKFKDKKGWEVYTIHIDDKNKPHKLHLDQESDGTQRLFRFAGPILDTLENGFTLIVDELHNSLHPLVMKRIIELFTNPKTNPNGAQFIFTTHDIESMDMLDNDEIWITDKDRNGQTKLKSISEFKGERSNKISKRYMSGRYGGIPNIGSLISDA